MAHIVAGMASSHAYTFVEPERWEARREVSHGRWVKRFGAPPPVQPGLAQETLDANQMRYRRIRDGLQQLKRSFETLQPDALIVIGDDQNENYRHDNLPQFAIYIGDRIVSFDRESDRTTVHRSDAELATTILNESVEAGFDLASSKTFPEDKLLSHAHTQILSFLDPQVPVVLLFVNAINVPAPTPARCYEFGQCLGTILRSLPDDRRLIAYASGGLSHFTGTYPWDHYSGPYSFGSISEEFDRWAVERMRAGEGAELAKLSSRDLLANGEIEMRQWIVLQGTLGATQPRWLEYEPFYRAIIGMSVAYWEPN
jgi:aromatic ring-opening dioxygenase LigB subunit